MSLKAASGLFERREDDRYAGVVVGAPAFWDGMGHGAMYGSGMGSFPECAGLVNTTSGPADGRSALTMAHTNGLMNFLKSKLGAATGGMGDMGGGPPSAF